MRTQRARGDHGYAIALLALVLIPLIAAAAVAVDLGSRYAAASDIQEAADAAALAGVAILPRGLGAATAEARQVAARNGFVHDDDGPVTVMVSQISSDRIQVTITDSDPDEYFIADFDTDEVVARSATARYVRAVELGSARNFLGTFNMLGNTSFVHDMRTVNTTPSGTLTSANTSTLAENFWLAISGRCTSRENGDRFNAISMANFTNASNPRPLGTGTSWNACNPGGTVQANPEFRDPGYVYSVAFPATYNYGAAELQVFDPATCSGGRPNDPGGGAPTTYTIRTGSTDPMGGTIVAGPSTFAAGSTGCSTWQTLATVTPPAAGATYFVQVQSGTNTNVGANSNSFSFRARVTALSGSNFWACSSDVTEASIYDPKCPQVAAVQDMGVLASIPLTNPQVAARFFLAEIGDEYSGNEMEVTLFDPGEGAERLRIIDPSGNPADFAWSVNCGAGITNPTDGCNSTGIVNALDLAGNLLAPGSGGCTNALVDFDIDHNGTRDRCVQNPQPAGYRTSRWKYNDRSLTLTVQLPADISTAYSGATWWKIEYLTNSAPTDRTTWSVRVNGDPVTLEPNP